MSTPPLADLLTLCGVDSLNRESPAVVWGGVVRELDSKLNGVDQLDRTTVRYMLAEHGCPTKLADAILTQPRNNSPDADSQGTRLGLADPEPWPEPVDGGQLLSELRDTFERYVVIPENASTLMALWVLFAHGLDAFRISPLLVFVSAVRGSGKTTALELLAAVLPRALFSTNITPAVLFRVIEKYRPSILIDEADTIFRDRGDELRTLVNASHLRRSAHIIRCEGKTYEPADFSTWSPKAIALIGELPPTLHDRAFVIQMRKRRADERIESFQLDTLDLELEPLKRRAIRWAEDNLDALRATRPDVPDALWDRPADNARPLLAVAELAGGRWPSFAREALVANLTRTADDETEIRLVLLADIRDVLQDVEGDPFTREILEYLVSREDRPWGEWRNGKALSGHGLGRLLKPFRMRSRTIRRGTVTLKGYTRTDFEDLFSRYLADTPASETSQRHTAHKSATNTPLQSVTAANRVTDRQSWDPAEISPGDGVTVHTPVDEEGYEIAEREGMRLF